MDVTLLGIAIEVSWLPAKAELPMCFTLFGIATEVIPLPAKAPYTTPTISSPSDALVLGMTIFSLLPL